MHPHARKMRQNLRRVRGMSGDLRIGVRSEAAAGYAAPAFNEA